jgi:hypothetical protein
MQLNRLLADDDDDADVSRCIVRLTTSTWADRRGLHRKQSVTFMRRQCRGYNILESDAETIGAANVWPSIVNLDECPDGVYLAVICNERRDYDTGYVEDWDLRLIPYSVPTSAR